MKHLLLSSVAIIFVTACSKTEETVNQSTAGDYIEEAGEATVEVAADIVDGVGEVASDAYNATEDRIVEEMDQHDAKGLTLRNLLGSNVTTSDDKGFGDISDLILAEDFSLLAYKIDESTLLGIGGEEVAINAERFLPVLDEHGEPALIVEMTEEQLNRLTESSFAMPSDFSYRLSQEAIEFSGKTLLEADVNNAAGERIADIYDLTFNPDGALKKIILTVGGIGGFKDKLVAVNASEIKLDALNNVFTSVDLPDLSEALEYDYDDEV